jgi:hypothetical protein
VSQLSSLTGLAVYEAGSAALVGAAAQLTGLRKLMMVGIHDLTDPMLLQLTALTALEQLDLESTARESLSFTNKAEVRSRCQGAVG